MFPRSTMVALAAAVASFAGACGALATPAQPSEIRIAPPPPPPPPPPCIQTPDAEAVVTHATGKGSQVEFCVGTATDQCFALELEMATLRRLPGPPATAAHTAAHVETSNPKLEVCTASACTSLTPKVLPGAAPLHATTNDAGTFAVVLLGDAEAGKGYAEIWDVVNTKRVASFKYARGDFKCGEVKMAGDTIFLTASTCGSPAARGSLYSLKGRKIADVGGRDFGVWGGAAAQLDATTWAFLEENGNQISVQDVVKGKVLRKLDVTPLWSTDGQKNPDAMGNPGESAIVHLGGGKLAVIAGAPATGRVATIDATTGAIAVTRAPVCK